MEEMEAGPAPDINRFKKYAGTDEEQAMRWVGDVTGRDDELQSKGWAMQECLKSGVVLCDLIEKLGGKRIKVKHKQMFHRENITQFITAAKELGLKDHQTFVRTSLFRLLASAYSILTASFELTSDLRCRTLKICTKRAPQT